MSLTPEGSESWKNKSEETPATDSRGKHNAWLKDSVESGEKMLYVCACMC